MRDLRNSSAKQRLKFACVGAGVIKKAGAGLGSQSLEAITDEIKF